MAPSGCFPGDGRVGSTAASAALATDAAVAREAASETMRTEIKSRNKVLPVLWRSRTHVRTWDTIDTRSKIEAESWKTSTSRTTRVAPFPRLCIPPSRALSLALTLARCSPAWRQPRPAEVPTGSGGHPRDPPRRRTARDALCTPLRPWPRQQSGSRASRHRATTRCYLRGQAFENAHCPSQPAEGARIPTSTSQCPRRRGLAASRTRAP